MSPSRALAYALTHRRQFLEDLKDFIRFPTISSQSSHKGDLKNCALWLAKHLEGIGLENVRVTPGRQHPIVYAESLQTHGRPTVLIYGHYDVQPVDPLREWRSPPFVPAVRGLDLYGRGACDDKGQMFTHIKSLESYFGTSGKLPVNVKCLFEGEEEIGSPSLASFVTRNKGTLTADVAIMSDTQMLARGRPAISYSERGALGLELEVHGPRHDLHSGNFGGAVLNPLQALAEMIAKLHDSSGRINIPGFYNRVRQWREGERLRMAQSGRSDGQILRDAGVESGWGEPGYTLYERTTIRPALTVNGITGGYQGSGGKGIIPARALAKLSFRLVQDQDPREVDRLFRNYIARVTPPSVQCVVRTLSSAKPASINPADPMMQAAAQAYRNGFGTAAVFIRSGGTIPVVSIFQETLKVPTVLMGFALPDDRIHAPNEKFHVPNFFNGIATCIWFLEAVSNHGSRKLELRSLAS